MAKKRRSKKTEPNLAEYRRKRDFDRTSEPAGDGAEASPSGRLFVVQKHAARQLHYDLRLELGGVLLSWAVPRGPSLDPKSKPLAVHVEDHPIEYGAFEGIIPAGEYGGGTVLLWDRGAWEPIGDPMQGLERGDLKFRLHGEKLRGAWVLARMTGAGNEGGRNWLLIKKRDDAARPVETYNVLAELPFSVASGRTMEEIAADSDLVWKDGRAQTASSSSPRTHRAAVRPLSASTAMPDASRLPNARRAALPATLKPQLAVASKTAPLEDGWLHEIKIDGYRLLARLDGGRSQLFTRNGNDWTSRMETVARAVGRLPVGSAFLDGEVVVLDADGRPDFGALQNAFRGGGRRPFVFYVFDVPFADGLDLRKTPLVERKAYLERMLAAAPMVAPTVQYCEHVTGDGGVVLEHAGELGLEGIVSKRADSSYVSRRSDAWVKVKCGHRQEVVVGGYTRPAGARTGFGALVVGVHDADGSLVYSGRVGSGFDEKGLESLGATLASMRRETPPFRNPEADPDAQSIRWVEPTLVIEVGFTAWTKDGLLRHAVFLGVREDKDPREVVREEGAAAAKTAKPRGVVKSPASRADAVVSGVRISHPDRAVYPEERITKREVAEYYERVADWILPHVARRPLSLVRCPLGLAGEAFYQKTVGEGFPAGIRGTAKGAEDGEPYLAIDDVAGLVGLAQMGVLEIHTWACREDDLEKPDQLVFDLDPGDGIEWEHIVASARFVRDHLDGVGLRSFVKTSGGKGLHVVVPIVRRTGWADAKTFAHAVAKNIVKLAPRNFVATMSRADRAHRVFVDYLRNRRGATAIAPYSTRARAGAGVATPLTWEELSVSRPASSYNVRTVPRRLARLKADPWAEFRGVRQSITVGVRRAVGMG